MSVTSSDSSPVYLSNSDTNTDSDGNPVYLSDDEPGGDDNSDRSIMIVTSKFLNKSSTMSPAPSLRDTDQDEVSYHVVDSESPIPEKDTNLDEVPLLVMDESPVPAKVDDIDPVSHILVSECCNRECLLNT